MNKKFNKKPQFAVAVEPNGEDGAQKTGDESDTDEYVERKRFRKFKVKPGGLLWNSSMMSSSLNWMVMDPLD